ncbi:DNA recombination and repair protein Rad51 C-terminal [Penicillium paradoxum]|uniref:DNA recombination and repair protein Rad51 C-terminal n=1 Tax=Penicillium paradoxum TaxID=176176 RepID=UPI0025481688|nr:DNA recombination and repair protein Rad51 C-terminal [Penicillium paradoxum]KAJ5794004.1 DNA recombination and repair protein Rad51 C-terminal [Penicillium paradoxum]
MDLLVVLPGFVTKTFTHIIPPLERARVTTVDVITLDALEIAKRARVPPADVRRLSARIVEELHTDVGFEKRRTSIVTSSNVPSFSINPETVSRTLGPATKRDPSQWSTISTLDSAMDSLLGGWDSDRICHRGYGGSGKTQFLLTLCLAVQLPKPRGLHRRAIYISTEHPLSTPRLSQILECHPAFSTLPPEEAPSLQDVLAINAMDIETQDHILNFHLPVAIERYNVGLVIIDSITSNYRGEYTTKQEMMRRTTKLAKLGLLLRNLAVKEDIAIVVANQVSDRFEPINRTPTPRAGFPYARTQAAGRGSSTASPLPKSRAGMLASNGRTVPSSSPVISSSPYHAPNDKNFDGSYLITRPRNKKLTMNLQERFFTGWGDGGHLESGSLKNPALGYAWASQIACRIALKKRHSRAIGVPPGPGASPAPLKTPGVASQSQKGNATANRDPDSIAMPAPDFKQRASNSQNHQPAPESAIVTRRIMKLVFSPWTAGPKDIRRKGRPARRSGEVEFEIWKGGLRGKVRGK